MATRRVAAPDLALLAVLSALWGASYTFIRIGVETIPPLTLMAARTVIAGALLALWNASTGTRMPLTPATWRRFTVQALLNSVVPFTLIAWAEQWVEAGLATILNSSSPIFTFIAATYLARDKPVSLIKVTGVGLGLVGICLVVGSSALKNVGARLVPQVAIVVATLCYAGAALYGRSFRGMPASVPAAGSLLAGAVILVPLAALADRPWMLHPSDRSLEALLALSVLSTAIALVIYFRLVDTLGPVKTTTQAYLRVPIGVGLSAAFLGESLGPTIWVGLCCVVAGVAAITLAREPQASV